MVVYIKDADGVRTVNLPDTRAAFCREVNRLSAETGIIASVTPFPEPPAEPAQPIAGRTVARQKA